MTFPSELLSGYVLAGGASSRMGQDKALLQVDGKMLVEVAVIKLRQVCATTAILCGADPDPRRLKVLGEIARTVPDTGARIGPTAGMAAALADAGTPWVLLLAVDQPFLPVELLRTWFAAAVSAGATASCLALEERLQPVPMLMQTVLAPAIEAGVHGGERKVRLLLESALRAAGAPSLHVHAVEAGLRSTGWFHNLNAPADLIRKDVRVSLSVTSPGINSLEPNRRRSI